jgi:hypothetical protein
MDYREPVVWLVVLTFIVYQTIFEVGVKVGAY